MQPTEQPQTLSSRVSGVSSSPLQWHGDTQHLGKPLPASRWDLHKGAVGQEPTRSPTRGFSPHEAWLCPEAPAGLSPEGHDGAGALLTQRRLSLST